MFGTRRPNRVTFRRGSGFPHITRVDQGRHQMSLAAQCRDCKKVYNVGEHQAGKKFRCKACGGVIVVPGVAGASPAPPTKPATRPVPVPPSQKRPAAAAAARPSDSDDPFNNMDALLSLETSGT